MELVLTWSNTLLARFILYVNGSCSFLYYLTVYGSQTALFTFFSIVYNSYNGADDRVRHGGPRHGVQVRVRSQAARLDGAHRYHGRRDRAHVLPRRASARQSRVVSSYSLLAKTLKYPSLNISNII